MAKQSTPHKNCKEADTYIYIISGVYIYNNSGVPRKERRP